ncbi:MAG: hypothetical protein AAGC96_14120 [Pseudomonadota bacterium]
MARHILAKIGVAGSILSLVSAICSALPLLFVVLVLGGAWGSVFKTVAMSRYYLVSATMLVLIVAPFTAIHTHDQGRAYALILLGVVLTLFAWMIIANEGLINSTLIGLA